MSKVPNFSAISKGKTNDQSFHEDSSFKIDSRKLRRIKRRTHTRKVTKIIHTVCVVTKTANGEFDTTYHQKSVKYLGKSK